jgi:hypothetical protein
MKEIVWVDELEYEEVRKVVELLLLHLKLDVVRTDEGKHYGTELRLEPS